MELKQPLTHPRDENVSEITILVFSFITAFIAGIIIISALFLTVKKIESQLASAFGEQRLTSISKETAKLHHGSKTNTRATSLVAND